MARSKASLFLFLFYSVFDPAGQAHAGTPATAIAPEILAEIAKPYVQLLGELDGDVPNDSAEILLVSEGLVGRYKTRIEGLSNAVSTGSDDATITRVAHDAVRRGDLCRLVGEVGETSRRIQLAERWCGFAIRDERLRMVNARGTAKQYNLAEIQRVYIECQMAIAVRRNALRELWALASGRAIVVSVDTYSGQTTPANAFDTASYVMDRQATVNAPINISPATTIEANALFNVDRLRQLKDQLPSLQSLGRLVDAELRHLGRRHLIEVKRRLATGTEVEKAQAVSSLGWWSGVEGRKIVEQALADKSPNLHQAGLAALARLNHSASSLEHFASYKIPDVRIEAARLAGASIDDSRAALRAISRLLKDDSPKVRREAYHAINSLLALYNPPFPYRIGLIAPVLRSGDAPQILEAINWVEEQGDNSSSDVYRLKYERLKKLQNHRDESICAAAESTLARLYAAMPNQ